MAYRMQTLSAGLNILLSPVQFHAHDPEQDNGRAHVLNLASHNLVTIDYITKILIVTIISTAKLEANLLYLLKFAWTSGYSCVICIYVTHHR